MREAVQQVEAVLVRRARATDLPQVEALLRAAGLPVEGVAESLETWFEVAEVGGAVAGVAGLESYGTSGLLRSVAVAAERQGAGIGETLVRRRLRDAKRRGVEHVWLLTTTAEPWFARFGFRTVERTDVPPEVQRTPEFSDLCPATAAVMVLPVAGDAGGAAAASTLKAVVREKYGAAARAAVSGGRASCCGGGPAHGIAQRGRSSCCGGDARNPITDDLYDEAETRGLPVEAMLASLGCGNPTALAQLEPGEVVLDLGSGGGIDVLLSARRVGPTGKAYGLDMTDDMLELARSNQARAGVTNVEFLKGEIEAVPLPDAAVDVIISNCVINLSGDKSAVLREAFRVLRPGGRFAVSDIVARGDVPEEVRRSAHLWTGCVAGALHEREYGALLAGAGFTDIAIEPTRVYGAADAGELLSEAGLGDAELAERLDGLFMSAFVRARKPGA